MKKVQLYLINDILYFIPTVSKGRMISKMIEPITSISINESLDCIGMQFLATIDNCKVTDGDIPNGNEVFKQFLKISKTKSNLQLVKTAHFVKVDCDGENCTLIRVGGNIKHKAFVEDIGIPSINIDIENDSQDSIGNMIKKLFLESEMTKDIIPIA
jgi:hypothetical protein